jgi:hypothetical protein
VVGAFVTFGVCLAITGVVALVIVPRVFANARGTLSGMVDDLTQASRAHAGGDSDKALDHFGRAVGEGVAWYSIGATRRFVAQAALGLLISFGGIIGAVLLFSQNTLLRAQNDMVMSQLGLLTDQNKKIDKQLDLMVTQNAKIDQQTMVADAQKRGAFATEMFSILQEVAKSDRADGIISTELMTRIVVLTSSAVPYVYLDLQGDPEGDGAPRRIPKALSPERGQLIVALARMKVKLSLLQKAGARFESADLRGADLSAADLSETSWEGCDFSGANLVEARFVDADLSNGVILNNVNAIKADFSEAMFDGRIVNSTFRLADFRRAVFLDVVIRDGEISLARFDGATFVKFALENVSIGVGSDLPEGLPWPQSVRDSLPEKNGLSFRLVPDHVFLGTGQIFPSAGSLTGDSK